MKIEDLPKNWETFANEISRHDASKALSEKKLEKNGAHDVRCEKNITEKGTMIIVKNGKFFVLSEKDLNEAKSRIILKQYPRSNNIA